MELDTTQALLRIVLDDPDPLPARQAATALVALHRELVIRFPNSPEPLRDLSVSLNKLAGIAEQLGDLDAARRDYTESLTLRRRLLDSHGPTPQALRDLSIALNRVARIGEQLGDLDAAWRAYTESLDLRRQILERFGATPQSLRDLTVCLNNVARIEELRGHRRAALEHYSEAKSSCLALEKLSPGDSDLQLQEAIEAALNRLDANVSLPDYPRNPPAG